MIELKNTSEIIFWIMIHNSKLIFYCLNIQTIKKIKMSGCLFVLTRGVNKDKLCSRKVKDGADHCITHQQTTRHLNNYTFDQALDTMLEMGRIYRFDKPI